VEHTSTLGALGKRDRGSVPLGPLLYPTLTPMLRSRADRSDDVVFVPGVILTHFHEERCRNVLFLVSVAVLHVQHSGVDPVIG
jgi:hypothetical protein